MSSDLLLQRVRALKLHGLIHHWSELTEVGWVEQLVHWEEQERSQRSLDRRLTSARIDRFKSITEFDWGWPKACDRGMIEDWMKLHFMKDATNLILCGPNGVGKSMIACNIAYQSVIDGYTALFTTAGGMLNELAALDSDSALRRRIKHYTQPQLLIIDEVGYLSYSNRHADLLFEIITRRYEEHSTLITTNKPFTEWRDIFPNAACVVSIIDRLVHHSEIVNIEADSFRLKEATEKNVRLKEGRAKRKTKNEEKLKENQS